MSNFVVNLREPSPPESTVASAAPADFSNGKTASRRRLGKVLVGAGLFLAAALLFCGAGAYFYWQHLKTTPQYSLALIVEASRNGDKQTTEDLVDINSVVDDFVPQITAKAIELYGRGLPSETIAKIANIARPLMPAIKDRARAELPKVINERTEAFQNIPFFAMVIGADRYLDIKIDGDSAHVTSKLPDKPFAMTMHRSDNRWRIVGIKDDELATAIAQKIGQEIVAMVTKGGINKVGETLGLKNLSDILKQAEDIVGDQ